MDANALTGESDKSQFFYPRLFDASSARTDSAQRQPEDMPRTSPASIPASRLVQLLAETDPGLLAAVDRIGEPEQRERHMARAIERDEAGAVTRAKARVAAILGRLLGS